MKIFVSSLLAAIAFAQAGSEAETTPAAAEEAEETPEPIVTELAWTDGVVDMNDPQITQLTDRTNPKAPTEPLGVTGTLTVMTDEAGDNWLQADLTGYWSAKWQATGTYNSYRGFLGFIIIDDVVTEEVQADGSVVTDTTQLKELFTLGGKSQQNKTITPVFEQWDMSNATDWDYTMSQAEYFAKYPAQAGETVSVWEVLDQSVTDNGASTWQRYFFGYKLSARRPFKAASGALFDLENQKEYKVGGSTWVVDNNGKGGRKEQHTGYQQYLIDMPVPEPPVEPEPKPDGDGTKGAAVLASSAMAATALLALAF